MSKTKRDWKEVRVREETSPGIFVKKSKFYFEVSNKAACDKYDGPGYIMSCETVKKDKILKIDLNFCDRILKVLKEDRLRSNKINTLGLDFTVESQSSQNNSQSNYYRKQRKKV